MGTIQDPLKVPVPVAALDPAHEERPLNGVGAILKARIAEEGGMPLLRQFHHRVARERNERLHRPGRARHLPGRGFGEPFPLSSLLAIVPLNAISRLRL